MALCLPRKLQIAHKVTSWKNLTLGEKRSSVPLISHCGRNAVKCLCLADLQPEWAAASPPVRPFRRI